MDIFVHKYFAFRRGFCGSIEYILGDGQLDSWVGVKKLDFFFSFWAAFLAYGSSQSRGPMGATASGLSHSSQQSQMWAVSENYTTDHGNAGPPTHWARPWIQPHGYLLDSFMLHHNGISQNIDNFSRYLQQEAVIHSTPGKCTDLTLNSFPMSYLLSFNISSGTLFSLMVKGYLTLLGPELGILRIYVTFLKRVGTSFPFYLKVIILCISSCFGKVYSPQCTINKVGVF